MIVETASYRLDVAESGLRATLLSAAGDHLLTLRPHAALDTVAAPDETLAVEPPRREGDAIVCERRSTVWEHAAVELLLRDDELEVRTRVAGRGVLTDAHLLAFRSLLTATGSGYTPTGTSFRTLFSPNPGDPGKLVRRASEPAVIGAFGDGSLGRGNWFYTPAPLWLGLTTEELEEPAAAEWVGLGLAAPVEELTFVELSYRTADRGFSLVLDYDGHTEVDGKFAAPALVLSFGVRDPYSGLRRHRGDLVARGAAPEPRPRPAPAWWSEPIFCGWGAQCRLARDGGSAGAHATQANYDRFLATLENEGVVPGTIAVDDKWQAAYATNEPDEAKWPDLRGWIAGRHERGQKVLLWWKAWDAEGAPPELCIRRPDGVPVALDPTNPETRALVRDSMQRMLSPDGLDADGLKIDFTARTPVGRALTLHGRAWGIALLHELLAVAYEAAKAAKPDALLITQTPHPAFVDVADMIRLNDMLRLDDPGPFARIVPQMRYRAAVAAASVPELPIDTDDWCVPSLEEWREYLAVKPSLGVPSLYYVDSLDWTREQLQPEDYRAIRQSWDEWRALKEVS